MAGVKTQVTTNVPSKLGDIIQQVRNPRPFYAQAGEYLLRQTRDDRFTQMQSPEGEPWEALQPSYKKRKHKNPNLILTLHGHMRGAGLRYQVDSDGLLVGSDRVQAAAHHFGVDQMVPAYQRKTKGGKTTQVKSYRMNIPARPFLGISAADEEHLTRLAIKHVEPST